MGKEVHLTYYLAYDYFSCLKLIHGKKKRHQNAPYFNNFPLVPQTCAIEMVIIGSGDGLLPAWRQAII